MKTLVSCCVVAVLCCFAPVFSDTAVLVPREVFIADEAELTFGTAAFPGPSKAETVAPGAVLTVLPADLPISADVTVKSVQVKVGDNGAQVTVRFVPWKTGMLQLPSFILRGVSITPPPVRIGSLVDKTGITVLESARSPLLVPGTTYLLYGLIAVFLAFCALAIAAAVHIRRSLTRILEKNHSGRRLALIHKQLRLLEKQVRKTGSADWYRTFARVFRMYFGSLCAGDSTCFSASTAAEIVSALRNASFPVERVSDFLKRTDAIRFSGRPVPDNRLQDVAETRELVTFLEAEAAAIAAANAAAAAGAPASEVADVQL